MLISRLELLKLIENRNFKQIGFTHDITHDTHDKLDSKCKIRLKAVGLIHAAT